MMPVKPMIEFSGVRSSCDIVARKADLMRSAASARSLATALLRAIGDLTLECFVQFVECRFGLLTFADVDRERRKSPRERAASSRRTTPWSRREMRTRFLREARCVLPCIAEERENVGRLNPGPRFGHRLAEELEVGPSILIAAAGLR